MSGRGVALAGIVTIALQTTPASLVRAHARELRVCADPNNLPFSNQRGQGLENRLAQLVAADLGATVTYDWWAQRRGFVRNTLDARDCDVLMGVPTRFDRALTTRPYYRSTYVFVTRQDRHLALHSLDDPRLRQLRVGVQMIGNDQANSPPAHALSRRGIVRNVVGYTVYGDYRQDNPAAEIVHAVARGDVDVALVWGPFAGYVASREPARLDIAPISPQSDGPLPFVFDISMGVRRNDTALRTALDDVIARRKPEIDRLLREYAIPTVDQDWTSH